MPDLNLKGNENEWGGPSEPALRSAGRKTWLIILLAGFFFFAVGLFVIFQSKILETEYKETTDPLAVITPNLNEPAKLHAMSESMNADSILPDARVQRVLIPSETSEVMISRGSAFATTPGKYTIQVSAWQSEWKAKVEADRLRELGFDVFITKADVDTNGKVWHRVRIGHYQNIEDARRAAEGLISYLESGYTIEKEN